jgi:serine/threonine-protein kinase HipA
MRVAAHAGLRTAEIYTTTVLGRPILVVKRYDRTVHDDGAVERIHQEDFCQVLGLTPRDKYEEDGGPSLRNVADIIQALATEADLEDFLRAVTLNVVLGNGDAHGKNFSLLHERDGTFRLAPLYDLLCTLVYGQNRLAMFVDTLQRLERVTTERIVNEASGWGMPQRIAREIVNEFMTRLPRAIDLARSETPGVSTEVIECVREQMDRVRSQ